MVSKKLKGLLYMLFSLTIQLNAQTTPVKVIQLKLENGEPAEKATVILNTPGKTGNRKVLLTDRLGIIRLPADGLSYSLYATFTSMEPINDTLIADVKTDTLYYTFRIAITELTAVQVSSRKKILEVKEDRYIYNISADSTARSKSISQVLGNLPFVTVDGAGEIQVAGQTSYKVLMNGKETALFVSSIAQAMRSFPAEIVSRIELITSPPARYDAEGITAIINIITKKFAGYKGFQTIYASNLSHFSAGLTLTGRTGKLGITVNATSDGTWNPLKEYRTITTTPLSASVYDERTLNAAEAVKRLSNTGTIELNFEMDSLHSVIGYITSDRTSTRNGLQQEVYTQLTGGGIDEGNITTNGSDKLPGLTAGLDYIQRAKKNPRKELSFRFNWRGNSNQINNGTMQQYNAFSKWMINQSATRNDEFTFQLDATPLVFENYTVETGLKTILRQASADFTSLFTFNKDSSYRKDATNSNSFNYNQQVYAAYGTISAKIRKHSFRLGLRLERTDIKGMFSNLSNPINENYLSLIPNFFWSSKTGTNTSVSLAYNLNLLRPYIASLNPFVNNIDSFNISYGNPGLGPQQIHKLVAQLRYNEGKLFVTTSLTGSFSNNQILSYRLFNATTGITAVTFGNVGKEQLISLGASINYQFSKKFKAGIWGDIRYVDIQNQLQKQQHNYGYSGIVGHFFTWDAGKRFSLSGSGGVDVRNVSLLGRRTPYLFYQINSGYHIIKNKLFATINWNNVHSDYFTLRTSFKDAAVRSETSVKRLYRVIFLGFQYTFGRLSEEVGRKKGVVNDDIL
jgi:hypothetical protein